MEILRLFPALWRFVDRPGVEPTNNIAERAIRPAVLWRKGSFGTHSAQGSKFATRMMTVAATLKQQGRSLMDFITTWTRAAPSGGEAPSLIPMGTD